MVGELIPSPDGDHVRRQQKALASFGTYAFREINLQAVLDEAARVCAQGLDVPFCKICRFRPTEGDLLVVAGYGWKAGVVGYAISVADESTPQGRAFTTRQPQLCPNLNEANAFTLPHFYEADGILSTVDVIVAATAGPPFGVLEVDSPDDNAFDDHDVDFLTGFANVLAEAVATSERAEALREAVAGMERLVDEKETLSQELKHRVRNSLHLVYGLLIAELDAGHEEASLVVFRSIAARVMGLAEVFDHLLGVGMTKIINLGDYVEALCRNIPALFQGTQVTLTCDADPFKSELDTATAVGIVVTELVSNSYLHAFPDGAGIISVVLRVTSGRAMLTICDNGIGFVERETKRRGIGLVRRLVQQVDGNLSHRDDLGSIWTITLPAPGDLPLPAAA
jgi:two-component sensor histidine kinase